jgi:hypothetical protein
MDFGAALTAMREGKAIRRPGWRGLPSDTGIPFARIIQLDDNRFEPMIIVSYPGRSVCRPFAGMQWDLLADDWEIAEDLKIR